MLKRILFIAFCGCLLFAACSTEKVAGSTETTNNKVGYKGLYGKLVDEGGKPVSGAGVKAIGIDTGTLKKTTKRATTLASDTDSVSTDDSGYYSFESLDSGTYNLQGDYDNGSLVVLITGIEYDSAGAVQEVKTDTLRAPGQIAGQVNTGTDDNGGVLCYIPGTSFLAMSNDTGGFVLANIPQGNYTVTYRKEKLETVNDTGVEVRSGEKTVLPTRNMEADPAYPPSAPIDITVSYDTLNGCVRLSWKPVAVSDLAGYAVYRNDIGSPFPERFNDKLAEDTVYFDTVFSDFTDTVDRTLAYRLKAQDKEANQSTVYSKAVIIEAPSPAKVRTFISFTLLNTRNDTASINDTVGIVASWKNETRKNMRLEWFADADDSLVKTTSDTALAGEDTLRLSWSDASVKKVYLLATDEGGAVWRDSVPIPIVQDVPAARAGNDTMILAPCTIPLHGSVVQKFGTIVIWEWRIGSGDWSETGGPDTFVVIPPTDTTVVCSLAVTDDDGNRSLDEVVIKFISKFRGVSAGGDYSVVLMTDGTLFGFGYNGYGQLTNVGDFIQYTPIRIINEVQDVVTGGCNTMMLKADGTLWFCGCDRHGETINLMQIMKDVKSMSCASSAMILKNDNTLWVYGYNDFGQLGGDTATPFYTPPVQIMSDVRSMSVGDWYSLILKTDNTLWACGAYFDGELFDGAINDRPTSEPVQVMSEVQSMCTGAYYCLIIKSDNTLWFCGKVWLGDTPDDSLFASATPRQIMSDVKQTSIGGMRSLILKTDGSLWAFGHSDNGMFGEGTNNTEIPVQIMNNVKSMSINGNHSLMLKTDNTLWACGNNEYGQLGDGTTTNRQTPVQIIITDEQP